MDKRVDNSAVEFLAGLWKLGEFFNAALNNYLNEDYNEVESCEDDGTEEPAEDYADTCACDRECDGCCDEESVDECGPAGPAEECDEYKLIISDYSVDTYEDALKIMTPKLNQMTFSMRLFAFSQAIVEFRFSGVTYRFIWDADADKFIGLEDNNVVTKEVYWDELTGQVKDLNEEEPTAEETVEEQTPSSEVPGIECKYRGESFYPYGENCKNCPHKEECFTTADKVEEDHESCSATYAEDGDAIVEEEIPSLNDYVGKKPAAEEFDSDKITGASLFNKLNTSFNSAESSVIESALVGTERVLKSNLFDIVKSDNSDKIKTISFSLDKIESCMPSTYPKDLADMIHLCNLAAAIKKHFEFAKVTIKNDVVYCDLV